MLSSQSMAFKFPVGVYPSALVILLSSAARAAQVFVEPATGSGVGPSDLETATSLVQAAVPDIGPNSVVSAPDRAEVILRPRLIRLNQAYVLSLSRVEGGDVVFSSQLKAETLDELDKVAERLTRSVLEGKRAASHPRVGEITEQEAHDGTQRKPVRKSVYVGFGGSTFGNLNSTGVGYSFGLAYSWDVNVARIKLQAQGDVNGAAFMVTGGLGANVYLTTEDIAPYLSGDFGGGAAKLDGGNILHGDVVGGFAAGVGAGVEFLRASAINVDLGFRAGVILHANTLGLPQVYSLRLGLYF